MVTASLQAVTDTKWQHRHGRHRSSAAVVPNSSPSSSSSVVDDPPKRRKKPLVAMSLGVVVCLWVWTSTIFMTMQKTTKTTTSSSSSRSMKKKTMVADGGSSSATKRHLDAFLKDGRRSRRRRPASTQGTEAGEADNGGDEDLDGGLAADVVAVVVANTASNEMIGRIPNNRRQRGRRKRSNNNNNSTSSSSTNATLDYAVVNVNDTSKWTIEETAIMSNLSDAEFYNVSSTGDNLWDNDLNLPQWIQNYMNWHAMKRQTWNLDDWKSERWLIMQSLRDQDKKHCGGTSDRLKPVPTLLKVAYKTRRILLIHWDRPNLLTEFLVPPTGGYDWRVPDPVVQIMANVSNGKRLSPYNMIQKYARSGMALVRTRYQTHTPERVYDEDLVEEGEPNFNTVFYKIWRMFFTPSPVLRKILQTKMDAMGLEPNRYVASHLRALYAVDDRPLETIHKYTLNALNCATELRPGVPIFFASDSANATAHALQLGHPAEAVYNLHGSDSKYDKTRPRVVVSIPDPNPPWHLDKYIGPPEMFFDTFVDLYLMAEARCVTYSKGGFGHWALLIGGNIDCSLMQDIIGGRGSNRKEPCKANLSRHPADPQTEANTLVTGPLYLEPMED